MKVQLVISELLSHKYLIANINTNCTNCGFRIITGNLDFGSLLGERLSLLRHFVAFLSIQEGAGIIP
jgi:hypothetical protein